MQVSHYLKLPFLVDAMLFSDSLELSNVTCFSVVVHTSLKHTTEKYTSVITLGMAGWLQICLQQSVFLHDSSTTTFL